MYDGYPCESIAQCLVKAKATWNPLYLVKAIYLLISQRRLIEVMYSLYNFICFPPSAVNSPMISFSTLNDDSKWSLLYLKYVLSLEDICHVFADEYAVNLLPKDFSGARLEGIVLSNKLLIIGEYGWPGSRIAIVSQQALTINTYYEKISSVRHIHSICNGFNRGEILVATGDTAKYLDLCIVEDANISFLKHLHKSLAGYTAMLRMEDECLLGTDFSGRPNFLKFLSNGSKLPFPRKAYNMFVVRLVQYNHRYILCLSAELQCLGGRNALSVFDVEKQQFVFCDYVQYVEPETTNKMLCRTAISLRSIATGELGH